MWNASTNRWLTRYCTLINIRGLNNYSIPPLQSNPLLSLQYTAKAPHPESDSQFYTEATNPGSDNDLNMDGESDIDGGADRDDGVDTEDGVDMENGVDTENGVGTEDGIDT